MIKSSLCLAKHHAVKAYGLGSMAPRILNLGARWRLVFILTPRPLYSRGMNPRYLLDRKLGRWAEPVGTQWRKFPNPHRKANPDRPVAILTELSLPEYCQQYPRKDHMVNAEANFDVAIGFEKMFSEARTLYRL
jgi:hypothetical protein